MVLFTADGLASTEASPDCLRAQSAHFKSISIGNKPSFIRMTSINLVTWLLDINLVAEYVDTFLIKLCGLCLIPSPISKVGRFGKRLNRLIEYLSNNNIHALKSIPMNDKCSLCLEIRSWARACFYKDKFRRFPNDPEFTLQHQSWIRGSEF